MFGGGSPVWLRKVANTFSGLCNFTGGLQKDGYSVMNFVADNTLAANADFDTLTAGGYYYTSGNGYTNAPFGAGVTHTGALIVWNRLAASSQIVQHWINFNSRRVYARCKTGGVWGAWQPLNPTLAWVNFNGTGTVAIRDSSHVSSITDNGTGDYTVNFISAFTDANYTVQLSFMTTSSQVLCMIDGSNPPTTSACRVLVRTTAGALFDATGVHVTITGKGTE